MSKALKNKVKLNDIVDVVADYGADPTGVADSTSAIQAAINAAFTAGGGVVVFPKGVYTCKNVVLKAGVTIMSEAGMFGYLPSTISNVTLQNTTDAGWVIDTSAASASAIIGFNFKGPSATTPAIGGIRIRTGSSWAKVANCSFNGFSGSAIQSDSGSVACVFEDLLATNCLMAYATLAAVAGVFDFDGADHFVNRVESTASLSAVSSVNLYACAVVLRGANFFVDSVVGEISDVGIYVTGTGLHRISKCRADLNLGHGFRFVSTGSNQVVGCLALNNSQDTTNTYDNWRVESTVSNCQFIGCSSLSNVAKVAKYGFNDLVSSATVKNVYVQPISSGSGTAEYINASGGSSFAFRGGSSRSLTANSATPSVAGQEYWNTASSIATTITDFTGGINGQHIYVAAFDANTTFQHNGVTIVLPGAVNITAVSGQIYHFVKDGVWRRVA